MKNIDEFGYIKKFKWSCSKKHQKQTQKINRNLGKLFATHYM